MPVHHVAIGLVLAPDYRLLPVPKKSFQTFGYGTVGDQQGTQKWRQTFHMEHLIFAVGHDAAGHIATAFKIGLHVIQGWMRHGKIAIGFGTPNSTGLCAAWPACDSF